jgi:hypothetical protein
MTTRVLARLILTFVTRRPDTSDDGWQLRG